MDDTEYEAGLALNAKARAAYEAAMTGFVAGHSVLEAELQTTKDARVQVALDLLDGVKLRQFMKVGEFRSAKRLIETARLILTKALDTEASGVTPDKEGNTK